MKKGSSSLTMPSLSRHMSGCLRPVSLRYHRRCRKPWGLQRLSVWGGGSWFLCKYGDECFCVFQLAWRWKCVIRCANMLYIYMWYMMNNTIYIYIKCIYIYLYIISYVAILYIYIYTPMIAIFCQPPIFWNKVITGRIPTSYMTWNLRKPVTWHTDIYII